MKLCARCKERERTVRCYCRPCKSAIDLESYHKNKEKRQQYQKEWLEKNPNKKAQYRAKTKEWLKNNPNYMNEWMNNKRDQDPHFRLNHHLQSRLHSSLKALKTNHTLMGYIGCSFVHLLQHLEQQFSTGMSWDNYGEWHIDHIKPISKFDFNIKSQIFECWNYKNLQPLWASDNLKKSNKYEE